MKYYSFTTQGAFAEFLVQYLNSDSEGNEDDSIILQDLEERLDQRILPRQRSKISESDSTSTKGVYQRQMSITSQVFVVLLSNLSFYIQTTIYLYSNSSSKFKLSQSYAIAIGILTSYHSVRDL